MNYQSNNQFGFIFTPISAGELIDKITILQIKKEKMSREKLLNIDLK